MKKAILCLVTLSLIISSCQTYYQRYIAFNKNFEAGKLKEAQENLVKDKKGPSGKNRLLYYMNRGVVESMLGNYQESNNQLEQAYITVDDYYKNPFNEGMAFLTNPNFVEYKPEDVEAIYIHYYKAFNYLKMNQPEEALVECKRMNIKLNALSDKYKSENKYKRDAFIHLLMGIIYEANQDANNAFIAYRNALEIYQNDYKNLFGLDVPEQLKKDIIRTAYQTGFIEDANRYKEEFKINYTPKKEKTGELIFLWHNGLGPIKTENAIEFIAVRGQGGLLTFQNEQMGLSFPFYIPDQDYEKGGLSKLHIMRIAFPQYTERPTLFDEASVSVDNQSPISLMMAEDINAISFKCLQERMLWEFGKALLRVAIKKAAEYGVRKENKDLGAAVGILNAFTEQADTRNWQTLPHSIYYCRIPLSEGKHNIKLIVKSQKKQNIQQEHQFIFDIKAGKTYFHTFHSLETIPSFTNY